MSNLTDWREIISFASNLSIDTIPRIFDSTTNPLITSLVFLVFFIVSTYVVSIISGNCSQVDRLWSLIPITNCWIFGLRPVFFSTEKLDIRVGIMSILVTIWGLRLSYNFYRKGGYRWHEEDYRWPALRGLMHPILFHVFNLIFISIYQNILIFLFSAPPIYAAWKHQIPLNNVDYIAIGGFVLSLLLEIVSDQQQWEFQSQKYALINAKKPLTGVYKTGFVHTGLWRYSRHPNFFAEMSIWWFWYLFSVAVGHSWVNWTITGVVLLTLLFQGSTMFTEVITAKKYPAYVHYQQTTSRLIPWFPLPFTDRHSSSS